MPDETLSNQIYSDHGFSQIEHLILLNVFLRAARVVDVAGSKETGGAVHLVIRGGAALAYALDQGNSAAVVERIKEKFDAGNLFRVTMK